jgi:hypothetical protein
VNDARTAAIVGVLVFAPFALVALAAIVRGYTISVHMKRPRRNRREE